MKEALVKNQLLAGNFLRYVTNRSAHFQFHLGVFTSHIILNPLIVILFSFKKIKSLWTLDITFEKQKKIQALSFRIYAVIFFLQQKQNATVFILSIILIEYKHRELWSASNSLHSRIQEVSPSCTVSKWASYVSSSVVSSKWSITRLVPKNNTLTGPGDTEIHLGQCLQWKGVRCLYIRPYAIP